VFLSNTVAGGACRGTINSNRVGSHALCHLRPYGVEVLPWPGCGVGGPGRTKACEDRLPAVLLGNARDHRQHTFNPGGDPRPFAGEEPLHVDAEMVYWESRSEPRLVMPPERTVPNTKLTSYRSKRDFAKTAEPKGSGKTTTSQQLCFVIQKHDATRLHYELRRRVQVLGRHSRAVARSA